MTQRKISILLIISIIGISFSAIFVKWSDAPSTVLSMYRMYFACILLLPMVWRRRKDLIKVSKQEWGFLALSGGCLGLSFALWFASLKLTTVASSTIILALQPILALVGGFIFYKERADLRTVLTIGIAILGVVLVGWGDLGHVSNAAILGDILSFLNVIAVVGYLLIGQNKVKQMSHWIYSFSVFLFAGIALHIYNLAAGVPTLDYPPREWGIFLLLAVFPTLSHVIFNFLLSHVNATTISMSVLGEPVGATILAAVLLGERVHGLQLLGSLVVLMGVSLFLIQRQSNEPKKAPKDQ